MINLSLMSLHSFEGAGERNGTFRTLVAVLYMGTVRVPRGVVSGAPGPAGSLGARPWPWLWLSRPSGGPELPPDWRWGRGSKLGARGAPFGGRPLYHRPPLEGALEPQAAGVPGSGQKGQVPGGGPRELDHPQQTHTWLCWGIHSPPPGARTTGGDTHATHKPTKGWYTHCESGHESRHTHTLPHTQAQVSTHTHTPHWRKPEAQTPHTPNWTWWGTQDSGTFSWHHLISVYPKCFATCPWSFIHTHCGVLRW